MQYTLKNQLSKISFVPKTMSILLSLLVISFAGCHNSTPIKEEKFNSAAAKAWVLPHFCSIKLLPAGKAEIQTTGNFICQNSTETSATKCMLKIGDQLINSDSHSNISLKLNATQPTEITFEMSSEFNHSSFGKNLITKTHGSVTLKPEEVEQSAASIDLCRTQISPQTPEQPGQFSSPSATMPGALENSQFHE